MASTFDLKIVVLIRKGNVDQVGGCLTTLAFDIDDCHILFPKLDKKILDPIPYPGMVIICI